MPSGSAYQALILPAPKRSAPPAAQGGTGGPPILIPHSASTTYHPGAISSSFSGPSGAPSHGTYSSAGVPPVGSSGGGGRVSLPAVVSPAQARQNALQRVQAVTQFVKALGGVTSPSSLTKSFFGGSSLPVSPLTKLPPFAAHAAKVPAFRGLLGSNLGLGRTDMGVDFTGSGPVPAVINGVVTRVDQRGSGNGWPGGAIVVVSGTGKDAGKNTYLAENVNPTVQVGQKVQRGTVLANAVGSYPFLEYGWAADPHGTTLAHATTGYTEGQVTQAGSSFLNYLNSGKQKPTPGPGKPSIPQNAQKLFAMLPSNVQKATARTVSGPVGNVQNGVPVKPAQPIRSAAGLTVKGAPVTPSQIQTANTILKVAHQLGVSKQAATAAIYTAIYESGLTTGDPANHLGYGGALAGSVSHFNVNDTVGQAKALLLGNSSAGYQGGGVVGQLKQGASIPEAAVRTEVPSIWPSNSYASESGYGSDARAVAEAQAFVDRYGGFGGGSSAPISGGSASAPVVSSGGSSSGGAAVSSGGSAPATGGAPVSPGGGTSGAAASAGAPVNQQAFNQSQQAYLLGQFLKGSSNPFDIGKGSSFNPGGLSSLMSSGLIPTSAPSPTDFTTAATSALQSLAGTVPLTTPSRKKR